MNPADILSPVDVKKHLPPRRVVVSPAFDLAWVRHQEKYATPEALQRTIDLTNAKWRYYYIRINKQPVEGL